MPRFLGTLFGSLAWGLALPFAYAFETELKVGVGVVIGVGGAVAYLMLL